MLDKIAYFAAGAVTGGLGVYFVLARKFEQDFQEATIEINKELAEIAEAKHKSEWEMALIQRIANPILSRWYRALLWTTLRLLWKIPTRRK